MLINVEAVNSLLLVCINNLIVHSLDRLSLLLYSFDLKGGSRTIICMPKCICYYDPNAMDLICKYVEIFG